MVKINEKYIIDNKGKKSAIIIPIEQYEELLEDLNDLTIIAERKNLETISLDELKKRLN